METNAPRSLTPADPAEPGPHLDLTTMDLTRATLLVVGTVGALVGAWLPAPEWARAPDRVVPRVASVALVLAAVGVALLWLRSRHWPERVGAARAAIVAGIAATVLMIWALAHLVIDLREGYVDAAGPVVAGGAGIALTGLLLAIPQLGRVSTHALEQPQAGGAGPLGRVAAAVLGLLLAAGLAIAGSTAPAWPVRTSGPGATAVAEVPHQVSQIGWTRTFPLYYPESLDDTWAVAGPGLVLITDGLDGPMVQALDGATGETVWTYRRVGARILRVQASPDGQTVYVSSTMEDSFMSDFRVQGIDARTGKLLGMTTGGDEWYIHPTTAGLLKEHHDHSLRSLSATDMSEQWSWAAGAGCSLDHGLYPTVSAIVLLVACGSTQQLIGLDPDTGTEIWFRAAEDLRGLYADAAADLAITLRRHHADSPRLTFQVLDAATGDPLAEIRSDGRLQIDRGYGCCAGTESAPAPVDARTGQPLSPPIQEMSSKIADAIGMESWDLQKAVLPGTLVLAAPNAPGPGQRREVTVAVYPFTQAAELVLLRTETPVPEELGLNDVREGAPPVVVAGPGAVFVLSPTFPVDDRSPGGALTVIGLQ